MTDFQLATERLILRPHRREDIPFMVKLNSDPEVVRYVGDGPLTEEEAARILERRASQWTERRIGRFVAIEKATGEKIGWCGLIWLDDHKVIDLGYRFFRDKWGQGFATEAARECLRYGFMDLGFAEITAHADLRNSGSVNVLRKLGFSQTGAGAEQGHEVLYFLLKRGDYRS